MADPKIDTPKTPTPVTPPDPNSPVPGVIVNVLTQSGEPVPAAQAAAALLATDEGKALAETIRTEERDKLHKKMDANKAARKTAEEERDQLIATQAELDKKKAKPKGKGGSEDPPGGDEELAKLREQVASNEEAIAAATAAGEAQAKVTLEEAGKLIQEERQAGELKLYRQQQLVEHGVMLEALVPETPESKESVDAAIQAALGKQKEISDKATADAQAALGIVVPTPLAPAAQGGQDGAVEALVSTPDGRRELGRKSPEDRAAVREKLLAQAEQATGWRRGQHVPTGR